MHFPILLGQKTEKLACKYLLNRGYSLLERNYRCRTGEIDIIMRDRKTLVFIEVRTRNNMNYAGASESVDVVKQQKIIRTATHYLQVNKLYGRCDYRFDIVAICYHSGHNPQVELIKNAFNTGNIYG